MDLLISISIVAAILILGNLYVYFSYSSSREALARKLHKYERILSSTAHGIFLTGLSGEILYMNSETKRFLNVIGLPLVEGDPIEVLVTKLNQYSDDGEGLDVKELIAVDEKKTIMVKLKGLLHNIAYYEVAVIPFKEDEARIGQVLMVRNVTADEVSKQIHDTIIKTSMNVFSLKSIEDTLQYFSRALEEIIDIDYAFVTTGNEEQVTYFVNHSDAIHSQKIIKSHIRNPIAEYVMSKHEPVLMDEKDLEDAGLKDYLKNYENEPKVLVACQLSREGSYCNGIVGLLFGGEVAYPELILESLTIVTRYISQVLEKLKIEEKIHNLAYYDQLTGLPNRNKFIINLEQEMINVSLSGNQMLGILFLDFSGLKRINDEYGHFVGDQLLKILAASLMEASDNMYFIGRLGGDEFGIYTLASTRVEFEGVARLVLDTIDVPYTIEGHVVHVTGNIGISIYREHGIHPEELIHKADEALAEAKAFGKSQYHLWE